MAPGLGIPKPPYHRFSMRDTFSRARKKAKLRPGAGFPAVHRGYMPPAEKPAERSFAWDFIWIAGVAVFVVVGILLWFTGAKPFDSGLATCWMFFGMAGGLFGLAYEIFEKDIHSR